MQKLFVFLAHVAALLTGITLMFGGCVFLLFDPPSLIVGLVLIGLGLLIISPIVWPEQAAGHSSATTPHRFSFEEEWEAAADGKVVRIASYRKKSGQPLARHLDGSRAWHGVGDSLCD